MNVPRKIVDLCVCVMLCAALAACVFVGGTAGFGSAVVLLIVALVISIHG